MGALGAACARHGLEEEFLQYVLQHKVSGDGAEPEPEPRGGGGGARRRRRQTRPGPSEKPSHTTMANTLETILAIRDSSWRDSTHHLILNLGDCYVDVVMGEEGSAQFHTLSFGGYGACSTFKGKEMPRELSDLLFGAMPAEPERAEVVWQQGDEDTARVRTMLSAALRPHAVGNVDLLATLEEQRLTVTSGP